VPPKCAKTPSSRTGASISRLVAGATSPIPKPAAPDRCARATTPLATRAQTPRPRCSSIQLRPLAASGPYRAMPQTQNAARGRHFRFTKAPSSGASGAMSTAPAVRWPHLQV
jgi:hypothetical protein